MTCLVPLLFGHGVEIAELLELCPALRVAVSKAVCGGGKADSQRANGSGGSLIQCQGRHTALWMMMSMPPNASIVCSTIRSQSACLLTS